MQGRPKKKVASLEEAMHAKSIPVIKKVKMSMKVKADQHPNSGPVALPPNEANARMFGVDAEDCHESSSDDSFSGASSRMTSPASHHCSITSDKDLREESSKNASNGQKDRRKSRKWFRLTHNKVALL